MSVGTLTAGPANFSNGLPQNGSPVVRSDQAVPPPQRIGILLVRVAALSWERDSLGRTTAMLDVDCLAARDKPFVIAAPVYAA